jgi:hypothetical protein
MLKGLIREGRRRIGIGKEMYVENIYVQSGLILNFVYRVAVLSIDVVH